MSFNEQGFQKIKSCIPRWFATYHYFMLRTEIEGWGEDDRVSISGDQAFDIFMAMSTEDIGKLYSTSQFGIIVVLVILLLQVEPVQLTQRRGRC